MTFRIDPRLPAVWRSTTALQLGSLRARAVIEDPGDIELGLLTALRAGASQATLEAICVGLGGTTGRLERLLERVAPALEPPPHEPVDRGRARLVVDGTGPTAGLVAGALACLGHRVVEPADEPDSTGLAVLVAHWALRPSRAAVWLARDVPHLPVVFDEDGVRVGPLVEPEHGPCLACLELERTEADAAWPAIATQLADRPSSSETPRSALAAAALVIGLVEDRLARGIRSADVEHRLDAGGGLSARVLRRHPACGCRAPGGSVTARDHRETGSPAAPSSAPAAAVRA